MDPKIIEQLRLNAQAPMAGSGGGRAQWQNGRFVLPEEKKKKGRGGTPTSLISEALGTIGGVGGFIVGGPVGAAAGAGLLGGVGSAIEQKVRDDEVSVGKAAKEGALEGIFAAGPIRLAKLGKAAATGANAARKAGTGISGVVDEISSVLGSTTKNAGSGILRQSTLANKSTLDSAVDQANLVNLSAKFPQLRGSGFKKFQNVEKVIGGLTTQVDDLFKSVKNTAPASRITDAATEVLQTMNPNDARAFRQEYNRIVKAAFKGRNPTELTGLDINKFRKIVNSKAARAFKGIDAGRPLSPTDNAILELRDISDDLLESVTPSNLLKKVRQLNGQTSSLIRAIPEFKRLSEEGVQLLGTNVPILSPLVTRMVQGGADVAGRGVRKSAQGGFGSTAARVGIGSAVAGGGQTDMQENDFSQLAEGLPVSDMSGAGVDEAAPQNSSGLTQEDIEQAILMDIDETGGKNIAKIEQLAETFGLGPKSAKEKQSSTEAQSLTNSVANLLRNYETAGSGQGAAGIGPSLLGRTPGVRSLGVAQSAQVFEDQRKALIAPLARAISGEVGVLTDRDISRAEGLLPRLSDPPQVAQKKIQDLLFLIQQSGGGTSAVGAGVDMTTGMPQ